MPDKLIVTNPDALKKKYGASGLRAIRSAVGSLIDADRSRGLKTVLAAIDGDPSDARAAKSTIDKLWKKYAPDYLMILGAPDVVPQVALKNPLFSPPDDPDKTVPSDLPYASEAPYGTAISGFLKVTRVVGRLPDLPGASDPSYLLGLLRTAACYQTRPAADYQDYFGISAEVWKSSTGLSLKNIFGNHKDLGVCPPQGPSWPKSRLRLLSHFINCHGAPAEPEFYGQKGKAFPAALKSLGLNGRISGGTVAAAECCYGADLYDPSLAKGVMGICSAYLGGAAYGFFGSTTIAYGPNSGNANADLICQYFLENVLAGASTGRATLEARLKYLGDNPVLSPTDLKTLGQFLLLGDPSIQPVCTPPPAGVDPRTIKAVWSWAPEAARSQRRRNLRLDGLSLGLTRSFAHSPKRTGEQSEDGRRMAALARRAGIRGASILTFEIRDPTAATAGLPKAFKEKIPPKNRFHVVFGRRVAVKDGSVPVHHRVVLVVRVAGGKVASMVELHAK